MTVPGKLARVSLDVPELKPGEVLVRLWVAEYATPTWDIFTTESPRSPNRR